MTYNEVVKIGDAYVLPLISGLYGLEGYKIELIDAHEGGRNVVYNCEKEGAGAKILRIAFLNDRSREDFLGEVEYIRYLFEHGSSVSNVVISQKGNLLEEMTYHNHTLFICLFEKARGKMLVENNYRYREGVPITEYFYNCGKVLGKLHQLSKEYTPVHRRYSFFDKYNAEYINQLIPGSLTLLKEKLVVLLKTLEGLNRGRGAFGMVHFDYNDGNYFIDFETGQITVYDFDNSCFCWYLYDLAGVWRSGVGWIQSEQDAGKRKKFMEEYFETVLAGYISETEIDNSMLEKLPLFINVVLMENILGQHRVIEEIRA
jgi:Ser/Thr protein kinase RdoA (MazF antagonist)